MADNPKAAWPKTQAGTTDWEYVFEDPSAGFIPLLSQVQSPEALSMGATVILEKLFTRKNDVDELTRLIAQLNGIVSSGIAIENKIKQVAALMREVKDERIEKARVYVERKKAGAAIDRRAGLFWKIDNLLKPIVLIPVGAVFVIVLSGLVYLLLHSTLGTETEAEKAAAATEQAAEDAADAADALEAAKPEAEADPLPIWFQTMRWPLVSKYTTDKPKYYSVTLYVMNWDHKIEVCRRLPTVTDRFYQSFSEFMPPERPASKDEIKVLEKEIVDAVNATLPQAYVKEAVVARYGTSEFRAAIRAPYCKSPTTPQPRPKPAQ